MDKQEIQDKSVKRPRRKFSDEFKRDVVEIVTSFGKPIAQVARELGIYDSTLGNWVKQDEINRGVRNGVTTAEREEITELRRENTHLRMERELSKRAVAFWVRESNEQCSTPSSMNRRPKGSPWSASVRSLACRRRRTTTGRTTVAVSRPSVSCGNGSWWPGSAQIHKDSGGTYGSPRVTAELHDLGHVVNHKGVERLMHIHNIVGYTPPAKTVTTIPDRAHRIPDLVKRGFFRDWLDQLWAGDISHIRTQEGFLYLSVVEDLASRRIVGLSMANHMRTELASDALKDAVGTRGGDVDGVVFHSDRGSQYTSGDYGILCTSFGIAQSVGRTGQCWDNAPVESFFATLKTELVYRTTFRTRAEARIAIRHWIESWYNLRRRSSVIGNRYIESPTNPG